MAAVTFGTLKISAAAQPPRQLRKTRHTTHQIQQVVFGQVVPSTAASCVHWAKRETDWVHSSEFGDSFDITEVHSDVEVEHVSGTLDEGSEGSVDLFRAGSILVIAETEDAYDTIPYQVEGLGIFQPTQLLLPSRNLWIHKRCSITQP
ncbi:hypothetical protein TWF281_006571 [Arthrobotrys megalospora]